MKAPAPLDWLGAIRDPALSLQWTVPQWERVVRLARRLRLLARLAEAIAGQNLLNDVPPQALRHLIAERHLSRWRTQTMRWTAGRVSAAFAGADYPRVLLKGAAYIAQDLPIAMGRLPSDLDVLVPRSALGDAQARLTATGWREEDLDEHDRRYYYEWSHEVPPMTHPSLAMELDLHHNILPPMAGTRVDSDTLLQRLRPVPWSGWQVLDPADQVLHCASHLFLDAEPRDRLRDLVDLDGLLRYFGDERTFWTRLGERARELRLGEPLALAGHFCARWLSTPLPKELQPGNGTSLWLRAWLVPLFHHALVPYGPDKGPSALQAIATRLLITRYYHRRLPLQRLVPHAWHKLRVGLRRTSEATGA